jgi:hypothetical protein
MTGTEPHARRGTAGRGPGNWDRRPCAGHCTALYEVAPPAVGSTGTMGRARAAGATRRRMRISASPAATPFGDRWPRAGRRSCSTRSGSARLRMCISAPPAATPFGDSGPRAGRRSCATRSGPTRLRKHHTLKGLDSRINP